MAENIVEIIVEIPKGSQNKYVWDWQKRRVRLDRVLHSSIHYPADYGFIVDTIAPDGRPVDVLILVTNPTFPGCSIVGKIIGCLKTTDEKGEDVKIIAVPLHDPRLREYNTLQDVPRHVLKEIEYFFAAYKALEAKPVEVQGWGDTDEAVGILRRCMVAHDV